MIRRLFVVALAVLLPLTALAGGVSRPSSGGVRSVVIYDQTSAANTLLSTGNLNVGAYSALLIEVFPSGAVAASKYISVLDPASALPINVLALPADASAKYASWGPGATSAASVRYIGGIAAPLPPTVSFNLDALGTGITGRLRVIAYR